MFSKKKTECRVCGYRFTPERENIYTAEEPRSMADMLTKAPTRFSAVHYCRSGTFTNIAGRIHARGGFRFSGTKGNRERLDGRSYYSPSFLRAERHSER